MIMDASNLQQAMMNISIYVTIESACTVMRCWYLILPHSNSNFKGIETEFGLTSPSG